MAQGQVKWAEIVAECGDYRAAIVEVFKKYQGQPTDEKDGAGRVVKVTTKAFARHMGIPEATLRGWINEADGRGCRAHRDRPKEQTRHVIKTRPEEVAKDIAKAMEKPEVARAFAEAATPTARASTTNAIHNAKHTDLSAQMRKAKEQEKRERHANHMGRWLEVESNLIRAKRFMTEAARAIAEGPLLDEQRDLIRERIEEATDAANLCGLALDGKANIDWDAALADLTKE